MPCGSEAKPSIILGSKLAGTSSAQVADGGCVLCGSGGSLAWQVHPLVYSAATPPPQNSATMLITRSQRDVSFVTVEHVACIVGTSIDEASRRVGPLVDLRTNIRESERGRLCSAD